MVSLAGAAAAGAWAWKTFGEPLAGSLGKTASEAGKQVWAKVSWQTAAERYRGEMQMRYGEMRIFGMPDPVPLADVFTDVTLLDKPSAWRRHSIEELAQHPRDVTGIRAGDRKPALDVILKHERLFILGQPGAGKTTLLKHLVLQCTTGRLDAVPIFVGLKDWSDKNVPLMGYLSSQFAICGFPDAAPFVQQLLTEGRALVLFDGLDEVNLEQGLRERITREVRDFAVQYRRSRCVITCRTAATDYQFEHFSYCELADFTEEQMRTFVERWFAKEVSKRDAFIREFDKAEHERLRDLGRTPLLLTLLCLTFDQTMAFPARRAELYEEALDALLKKWDGSRSIQRDVIYQQLSLGHKRQLLAELAAVAFERGQIFLREADLVKRITAYLERVPGMVEPDGQVVLQAIEAQHGLLIERAQGIYSFSHLTLQEYFTARYIAARPREKQLRALVDHGGDSRWREVFLLVASMLDDESAMLFLRIWGDDLKQRAASPRMHGLLRWSIQWGDDNSLSGNYTDRLLALSMCVDDVYYVYNARRGYKNNSNTSRNTSDEYMPMHTIGRIITGLSGLGLIISPDSDICVSRDYTRVLSDSLMSACVGTNRIRELYLGNVEVDRTLVMHEARFLGVSLARSRELAQEVDKNLSRQLSLDYSLIRAFNRGSLQVKTNERTHIHELMREIASKCTHSIGKLWKHRLELFTESYLQNATSSGSAILWWYTYFSVVDVISEQAKCFEADLDLLKPLYDVIGAMRSSLLRLLSGGVDRDVVQSLLESCPTAPFADPTIWLHYAKVVRRVLIKGKNIGHHWDITLQQAQYLDDYLDRTTLAAECVRLATISTSDREAMLNELMRLPEPI